MAGNDPTGVKQNAFIESNGLARELIERRFRLTPRTIGAFAVFGIFVPTMIYRGAVKDFVRVRSFLRGDDEDDDACESRRLFFLFFFTAGAPRYSLRVGAERAREGSRSLTD
jgi:hypothetical protein